MNKYRDIHQHLADTSNARTYEKEYFFWQEGKNKKERWQSGSTYNISEKATLVSLYSFPDYQHKGWSDDYANSIPRRGPLFADFDCASNPADAINDGKIFVKRLLDMGVPAAAIIPAASGKKGCCITVDSRAAGDESYHGHVKLPSIHKAMITKLAQDLKTIDLGIYNYKKGRLVRRLNYQRHDNGAWRAVVSIDFFLSATPEEILAKTSAPGEPVLTISDLTASPQLEALFNTCKDEVLNQENRAPGKTSSVVENLSIGLVPKTSTHCIPCLEDFNKLNFDSRATALNFNKACFLLASILQDETDDAAIALISEYLKTAPSKSCPTYEAKRDHFIKQLRSVRTKQEKQHPCCRAIRRNLRKWPCRGCDFLKSQRSVFSKILTSHKQGLAFEIVRDDRIDHVMLANAYPVLRVRKVIFNSDGTQKSVTFVVENIAKDGIYTTEFSHEEMTQNDLIHQRLNLQSQGRILVSSQDKKAAILYLQFALLDEPYLDDERSFDKTGWYAQTYVFTNCSIAKGKATFTTGPDLVSFPSDAKSSSLRWTDVPLEQISKSLKRYLEILVEMYQKDVVAACFGFSKTPIVAGYLNHETRFYLLIRGASGASKTTLARAMLAHWGNFEGLGKFLSASSTANRLEKDCAYFQDALTLIDDVKEANISSMVQFQRVIQNYADGAPRGRLNADSSMMSSDPIRAWILLTGEDSFVAGETSLIGRGLEIEIGSAKKDHNLLTELKELKSDIQGVLPHFIAYVQTLDQKNLIKDFANLKETYAKKITTGDNLDRIIESTALLALSLQVFERWTQADLNWKPETFSSTLGNIQEHLTQFGKTQAAAALDIIPGRAFVRLLTDLLASKRAWLVTPDDFYPENKGQRGVVGFLFEGHGTTGHAHILPSLAFNEVKAFAAQINTPLAFSLKAVASSLDQQGLLVEKDANRLTKKKRSGNSNTDFWVIEKEELGIIHDEPPTSSTKSSSEPTSNPDTEGFPIG